MHEIIQAKFYPLNQQINVGLGVNKHQFISRVERSMMLSKFDNFVLIGIGSNVGESIVIFQKLLLNLMTNSKICILETSYIYRNPPFGFINQDDFYNSCILLSTSLGLIDFASLCFYLERRFNRDRKREFKNAPRSIDIDILLFNNLRVRGGSINVPHPGFFHRASVLVPLYLYFALDA